MFKRTLLTIALALAIPVVSQAQKVQEFKEALDSMQTLLRERTTVASQIKAKKIVKRDNVLDFYFTNTFGDYPWRDSDVKWFREKLKPLLPGDWSKSTIGDIYVGNNKIDSYVMPKTNSSGKPRTAMFRAKDHRAQARFITRVGEAEYTKGLSGRNIALWQSHGRYYDESTDRWKWQRAPLFQTVEDMYTQSYVLPFLMPMLENSGAYVMTPRERDPQVHEIIADNDPAFKQGRGEGVRTAGFYSESGSWHDAGIGFADFKAIYTGRDNPFRAGTARQAVCFDDEDTDRSEAVWTPDIPERGEYAVYISYKSFSNSSEKAHYTVHHLGGKSEFLVNQKMGGGTWIYLGTFEFAEGRNGYVSLDNEAPEGYKVGSNTVVTADAVRFGGGMGKVARGPKDADPSEYTLSGLPSFAEGSYYWTQWAGADSTLLDLHEGDYTADFAERGAWVDWMSGGSRTNPQKEGLKIPVDMSFAFHSDAGTFPNDSIVGTLAIYTLLADNKDKYPNGESRWQGRLLSDFVQTQVVEDIRRTFNPKWTRRGLWDRSYSESRTTTVPGMILESLSHQNFEDMKFGLDPTFRFAVSRAAYKGILKFLSARYGHEYAVQPLPVASFATAFKSVPEPGRATTVRLSWTAVADSLEPTATPTGFILQTRIGDGAFDAGKEIEFESENGKCFYDVTIQPGKLYSFRIIAFNEGGRSFPSETLCAGVPDSGDGKSVLVVNNFTRLSAPVWFDSPDYAGFLNRLDAGVPYMREINFIGEQYQIRRELPWIDDDNPGFGASFSDHAGTIIPGNTFDFVAIHGKAVLKAGYSFHSASSASFEEWSVPCGNDVALDLICGKQVTTPLGNGVKGSRFQVFPKALQKAIKDYSAAGGNLIVSGAHIGIDVWDKIFPGQAVPANAEQTKVFVEDVLGYRWAGNFASRIGTIRPQRNSVLPLKGKLVTMEFWMERNPFIYNVETPDALAPANEKSVAFLRYGDTGANAGIIFDAGKYKAVSLGFPIEVMKSQGDIDILLATILSSFAGN
ncbi:MAG: xanthan lyase [Bacteroidales bacterium]|nr:xanthan lyase [Bacteroidales bacterium]